MNLSRLIYSLFLMIGLSFAIILKVGPDESVCVHDNVTNTSDTIVARFESNNNVPVDFTVLGPRRIPLSSTKDDTTGVFTFVAGRRGDFSYCFALPEGQTNHAVVRLNLTIGDESTKNLDLSPVETRLVTTSNDFWSVQSEQNTLLETEQMLSVDTVKTARMVWIVSAIVLLVILGLSALQIFAVKAIFKVA